MMENSDDKRSMLNRTEHIFEFSILWPQYMYFASVYWPVQCVVCDLSWQCKLCCICCEHFWHSLYREHVMCGNPPWFSLSSLHVFLVAKLTKTQLKSFVRRSVERILKQTSKSLMHPMKKVGKICDICSIQRSIFLALLQLHAVALHLSVLERKDSC